MRRITSFEKMALQSSSCRKRGKLRDVPCCVRGQTLTERLRRSSWVGLAVVVLGCLTGSQAATFAMERTPSRQQQLQQRSGNSHAATPAAYSSGFLAGPRAAFLRSRHHPRTTQRRRMAAAAVRMFEETASRNNYFEVLGVQPQDDLHTIKKAYRQLCLSNHPDLGGAKERFQLINEAYKVLSDSSRRLQHQQRVGGRSRTSQRAGEAQVWKTSRYVVGDVVGHLEEGWEGVILGIDQVCQASERWIQSHSVDRLPHGRQQRFFHVLPSLPQTEAMTLSRDFKSGSKIIYNEPAFYMDLGDGGQDMPALNTIYVSEDEIYHWRFSGGEGMDKTGAVRRSRSSSPEHYTIDGPVKNSLLHQIFSDYRRGRYGHDGQVDRLTFTPVVG